jgi:hypothetical protein
VSRFASRTGRPAMAAPFSCQREWSARVVAEIDTQPYELLRMRHVLDSENGPDADVDLVEVRSEDEGFDGTLASCSTLC